MAGRPLRRDVTERGRERLSFVEAQAILQAMVELAEQRVEQVSGRYGVPIAVVSAAPVVIARRSVVR